MKLIIGLGNPGQKYRQTRHNIGFQIIENIALRLMKDNPGDRKWRTRVGASVLELPIDQEKVLLATPQKFMNQSGSVVNDLIKYYNATVTDILVIADDLELDFGTIRVREAGGAAGHNGLKSIIQALGSEKFKRLKIGIKNQTLSSPNQWEAFVLNPFSQEEKKQLEKIIDLAADFVLDSISSPILSQTFKINEAA